MRESELHNHLYTLTNAMAARWPQVIVGPGDDCAVVNTRAGDVLVTVDQVVEGVHFHPGTPVDLIARKAVARSLSDIAAMGGTAAGGWGLATGLLPSGDPRARPLIDALHAHARRWSIPIVGGDIAFGPVSLPLSLTLTIAGLPHPSRGPVLRSGARAGDELWITGRIGNSLASGRHLTFEPRLAAGAWLAGTLGDRLHAMIDLSDGLGIDASRLARSSGVRIEIDGDRVPRHTDAPDPARAIADGEDHELAFCVAPGANLPATAPEGLELTRIGRVVPGAGCTVTIGGHVHEASRMGWDHG
ncbi:MAG: thiamine-phosphate kinase [Phycisphaerales bacterium]